MEITNSLEQYFTEEQKPLLREWGKLFELCNNPPPEDLEVGAVVMPTGDWLDRAPSTLDFFKERFRRQSNPPYLVVTGKHSHPDIRNRGASADKVIRAFRFFGRLTKEMKDRLIAEAESTNTKMQTTNVYALLEAGTVAEPLALIVSAYHLPRFYSTFLKTIFEREGTPRTRLFSIPIFGNWEEDIPKEPRGKRYEQIVPEMKRIHTYRLGGDVATAEELTDYDNWLKGVQYG